MSVKYKEYSSLIDWRWGRHWVNQAKSSILDQNMLKWAYMKTHSEPFYHLKHIRWYGPLHHQTHIVPCITIMFCWCTQVSWYIFTLTGAYQRTSFLANGRFWRGYLIMKTQVKTSTERVSVGQKWPNHGTCVEWEYKSCISWTYMCSGDFKRQSFSPFCARVCICFQWLAAWVSQMFSAARDVIWTARGNSIIIEGNAPARATAKPSTIEWFHLVPPEYFCQRRIWKIRPIEIRFFDILMIIII